MRIALEQLKKFKYLIYKSNFRKFLSTCIAKLLCGVIGSKYKLQPLSSGEVESPPIKWFEHKLDFIDGLKIGSKIKGISKKMSKIFLRTEKILRLKICWFPLSCWNHTWRKNYKILEFIKNLNKIINSQLKILPGRNKTKN